MNNQKLMQRLALASLTQRENKCLWALIANPETTQREIVRLTGLSRSGVSETIKKLLMKRIVTSMENNISLNPTIAEWRELLARRTFPKKKEKIKEFVELKPKSKVQDQRAYDVAKFLLESIWKWYPDYQPIGDWRENWATHMDLLIRVDKKDPATICQVITGMSKDRGDGKFSWRANVMSGSKLRHQFHRLQPKYGRAVKREEWRNYDNPDALKPIGAKD